MASRSTPPQVALLWGNQQFSIDERAREIESAVVDPENRDFNYHRFDASEILRPAAAESVAAQIDQVRMACESLPLLGGRFLVRIDRVGKVRLPARAIQTITNRLAEILLRPMQWEGARVWVAEAHLLPGDAAGEPTPLQEWIAEVSDGPAGGAVLALRDGGEDRFLVTSGGTRLVMSLKPFLREVLKGNFSFADEEGEDGAPTASGSAAARLHQLILSIIENPPPDCWLLLTATVSRERDLSKPLLVAAKAQGKVEKFLTYDDYSPVDWVIGHAAEKALTLGRQEAGLLIHYVGNDLGRLAQEVEKLSLLFDGKGRPNAEALRDALHAAHGGSVFMINDKLGERDLSGSLEVLEKFLQDNPHEFPMLTGVVARHFRTLYAIHSLRRSGVSDPDIAGRIKVHPFIAKRLAAQAGRFAPVELEHILQALAELDRASRLHSHLAPVMFRDWIHGVCAGGYGRGSSFPVARLGRLTLPVEGG